MKREIENDSLINSNPRCEICFNNIDFKKDNRIKEYYKRCINCGSWYHSICELEFFGRNFSNNKCYSCNTQFEKEKKCIICKKKCGMMINCNNNKWIHILCFQSFDFFFNIKAPNDENIYTDSIIKVKSKKCNICNERSILVIKCSKCGLQFHPFCAFKADFNIKKYNNFIDFPCCKHHFLYCNNKNNDNIKENNYFSHINYEQKYKDILSFNFKTMKDNIHLNNRIYSNKCNGLIKRFDHLKYKMNWDSFNIYFQDFNQNQINTFVNTSHINNEQIIPKLENYKLGNFVYRGFNCYLLFKIGCLDTNSVNFSKEKIVNKNVKFLNKKRLLKKNYFEIDDNIDEKILLKRAFGISKISKKLLYLEALAREENANLNLDCKYNFVSNEIKIKETMLNIISKRNSILISKLKLKLKEYKSKKENYLEQIKRKCSKMNYLKIIKTLTESFQSHYGESLDFENINECDCCVCFGEFENTNIPILYCDGCNVGYHLNCYGLYNIPTGKYYCDLCKTHLNNNDNIYCSLCQGNKGAMKYINEYDCWIHVTCALISNFIEFDNYRWFKGIKCFIKIQELVNVNFCCFCYSNKGELFQCFNCGNFSHFFCAYFNGALFSFENNKNNWKKYLKIDSCICNFNNNQYNHNNGINNYNNNNNGWNEEKRLFEIKYRKLIYQHSKID